MKNAVLAIALTLALASCGSSPGGPVVEGGSMIIPLAEVADGKAHFFSTPVQDVEVRFFIIKSGDGVVRAALDACDACYPAGKGYSQARDFMVCNNCGLKFHSSRINVARGGCNPVGIGREVKDDKVLISMEDLKNGARYFPEGS